MIVKLLSSSPLLFLSASRLVCRGEPSKLYEVYGQAVLEVDYGCSLIGQGTQIIGGGVPVSEANDDVLADNLRNEYQYSFKEKMPEVVARWTEDYVSRCHYFVIVYLFIFFIIVQMVRSSDLYICWVIFFKC